MKPAGLVALLFALSTALYAGRGEGWTRLDAHVLPEQWASLRESVASRPWAVADFAERRYFPFRNRPVELTGTVWYGRAEGLTLNYLSPGREVVRVDASGVRVIESEAGSRERTLPDRGREVPMALLSLFRLDFAGLAETFEIEGWRGANEWALRLTPREEAAAPIRRMELRGGGAEVTHIVIELSSRRRIELALANTAHPNAMDDDERARAFP